MERGDGRKSCGSTANFNAGESWPWPETLTTLTELNEQCLELVARHATLDPPASPPMLCRIMPLWLELDAAARRRASACPFLLVDAGFSDPLRWRWICGERVADADMGNQLFFAGTEAARLSRQLFASAWYIVRTQPAGAALYLGMPSHCLALFRSKTLRQIDEIADRQSGWLRPRWPGRWTVWRELLLAGIAGDAPELERARLHGVQLLAMELRVMEQVSAEERRQARAAGQPPPECRIAGLEQHKLV